MRVQLKNVRLAFPNLFKATQVKGEGDPAFSASFLMAPDHPAVKVINKAIDEVAKAKWGKDAPQVLKSLRATDKVCLHDGDTKSEYEGYTGNLFVSARSKVRPTVLNADKTPLTSEDGKPYSGCYVNAIIELWAQANNYGKRINASLAGVQFFRDGDAFAGGAAPADADDFEDVSTDGESDPMG